MLDREEIIWIPQVTVRNFQTFSQFHMMLQVDLHYNGFCNSVLWQLFHYVPLNTDTKLSETRTLQFQWIAHQEANRHAHFPELVIVVSTHIARKEHHDLCS